MGGDIVWQTRCPACTIEHDGPQLLAISLGNAACSCGHSFVYTDREVYRAALRAAYARRGQQ